MFLNAHELERECGGGRIRIEPFARDLLKPASYILRLGPDIARCTSRGVPIDPWTEDAAADRLRNETVTEAFVLHPNEFVLGATLEAISVPNTFMGLLSNLSHWARFGVSVHQGAAWVSPHFGTHAPTRLTLELHSVNPEPIILRPGMPICQIAFAPVRADPASGLPLNYSVYDGAAAPGRPRLYEEFGPMLPPNGQ